MPAGACRREGRCWSRSPRSGGRGGLEGGQEEDPREHPGAHSTAPQGGLDGPEPGPLSGHVPTMHLEKCGPEKAPGGLPPEGHGVTKETAAEGAKTGAMTPELQACRP